MEAIRLVTLLVTLTLSHHAAQLSAPPPPPPAPPPYAGAGAWIDRYDFPLARPELVVGDLVAHGIRTVYVETGSWKVPRGIDIVAPEQTADLITAAHANGMKVVAWYLPGFDDLATDLRRVRAALAFTTADGQKFDSFALDIEATRLKSLTRRNRALMKLSRTLRVAVGPHYPLGAIVPDQLSTAGGTGLWPHFPYRQVAKYYDVFLPMAYSSYERARTPAAIYRYTASNVRFVRRATRRPVHLIGGTTDMLSFNEEAAVARAARATGAVGASLYKYSLMDAKAFAALAPYGAR